MVSELNEFAYINKFYVMQSLCELYSIYFTKLVNDFAGWVCAF